MDWKNQRDVLSYRGTEAGKEWKYELLWQINAPEKSGTATERAKLDKKHGGLLTLLAAIGISHSMNLNSRCCMHTKSIYINLGLCILHPSH